MTVVVLDLIASLYRRLALVWTLWLQTTTPAHVRNPFFKSLSPNKYSTLYSSCSQPAYTFKSPSEISCRVCRMRIPEKTRCACYVCASGGRGMRSLHTQSRIESKSQNRDLLPVEWERRQRQCRRERQGLRARFHVLSQRKQICDTTKEKKPKNDFFKTEKKIKKHGK